MKTVIIVLMIAGLMACASRPTSLCHGYIGSDHGRSVACADETSGRKMIQGIVTEMVNGQLADDKHVVFILNADKRCAATTEPRAVLREITKCEVFSSPDN